MKVYVSGKMTGLSEEKIWDNFRKVETFLAKHGHYGNEKIEAVMNPAVTYAMQKYSAFSYEDWLHIDFAMLDACDAVALLPNWKDSMGAKREIAYAYKHGKEVCYPNFIPANGRPLFKFDGEKYNNFYKDEELTKKIALEVEKYDTRKALDNLLDEFCERKAKETLEEEVGQIRAR
jgi:hypothetical protein